MKRRRIGFIASENIAKHQSNGARKHMNVAMTQARRPSYRSETTPTMTPPGIIPTE
jgi:hypothetical protein